MVEIKENAAYVFGHPYMIKGIVNEDCDHSAYYDEDRNIFVVDTGSGNKEMTVEEFEDYYTRTFNS